MPRILEILAHPQLEHSPADRALADAARAAGVEVRGLYARTFDYLVWLHPIDWYGMPPLMKLWLDAVFGIGLAYGPDGQALQGTDRWLATSNGGLEASYRSDGHNR